MTKSRDSIESELKEKEAERKKLLNDVQELKVCVYNLNTIILS